MDTHIYPGYTVPHYYDSLIAKLIVYSEDRMSSIARMKRALREFHIRGIETNVSFHLDVLEHSKFFQSEYTTSFISDHFGMLE